MKHPAKQRRERIDWARAPTVYVVRPVCPSCGCHLYDKKRTAGAGNQDQSRTKRVVCRGCEQPYNIAIELPESGINEMVTV